MTDQSEFLEFQDITKKLLELAKKDQQAIMASEEEWERYKADPQGLKQTVQEVKAIVDQIGWPTVSKVGSEASHAAWLLVQHSDIDLHFQQKCLKLMEPLLETDEIKKREYAYLEDRVNKNSGKPQRFGTQIADAEGNPYTLTDPEHLDELRASMGLGTFEQYRQFHLDSLKKLS